MVSLAGLVHGLLASVQLRFARPEAEKLYRQHDLQSNARTDPLVWMVLLCYRIAGRPALPGSQLVCCAPCTRLPHTLCIQNMLMGPPAAGLATYSRRLREWPRSPGPIAWARPHFWAAPVCFALLLVWSLVRRQEYITHRTMLILSELSARLCGLLLANVGALGEPWEENPSCLVRRL